MSEAHLQNLGRVSRATTPATACHQIGEVCATHGGQHITRCVIPAEVRPGISDRNAAALADVADLRRVLLKSLHPRLDRIEQALRHE